MPRMETPHQRALAEVLRVNANLSRAMRFEEGATRIEELRLDLREARLVLALEKGLKTLPFELQPGDLDMLIDYLKKEQGTR